jgi:hypothetical protein
MRYSLSHQVDRANSVASRPSRGRCSQDGIDPMFVTGPQRMGVHDEGGDLTLGNQPLAPATVPFYRHQPRASEPVSHS